MSTGGRSISWSSERTTGLRFPDAAGAARPVGERIPLLYFASFCVVSPEKKAFRLFSVTCHFLPNLILLILPSRRYLWMETPLIPRSSTRSSISYTFLSLITFIRFSPYAWTAAGSRSFRESPVSSASDLSVLSFAETQRLVNVPAVFMPPLPGGVLPCGPPVFVDQSQAGDLPVFSRPDRPSFHPGPHSQQLLPP